MSRSSETVEIFARRSSGRLRLFGFDSSCYVYSGANVQAFKHGSELVGVQQLTVDMFGFSCFGKFFAMIRYN